MGAEDRAHDETVTVVRGPRSRSSCRYDGYEFDVVESNKERFLQLAESYAWLNPHLSLRVTWNGEPKIEIKASNPAWNKWLPSWPTSAHWYDQSRFRRYMAAHIANRGNITVREFISEFRGMTSTAKQKEVLAETGASHVSLHSFFGLHKAYAANIAKLLASIKKHTKPVRPAELGVIGKEHFFRLMEEAGGDPRTFTYNRNPGETNGNPWVAEFAFGIHRQRSPRRSRAKPQSHHRRELVAGHQQSVSATRARRHQFRRGPGESPRQHFAAGDRRAARGVPAGRVHRPRQVSNRS